eukprot:m.161850 g.161850  ORF g.161850 m.161850 type:complete len:208 (+) comp9870_c0_seq1:206-829(+)
MSKPFKLIYFNFPGRAEAIRLAFAYGGIPFEDVRVERAEWPTVKATVPGGRVPVLILPDGTPLSQSGAILRFIGQKAGLIPTDPLLAARVEEVFGILEDIAGPIGGSSSFPEEQKKAFREKHLAGNGDVSLKQLDSLIAGNPAGWTVGPSPTIADLSVYAFGLSLQSGIFDYVPKDLFASYPHIAAAIQKVAELAPVQAWNAAHKKQ